MYYYDQIAEGNYTLDSTLLYTSDCYEAGAGTTAYTYSAGSYVPLGFLLEQSIVNSDNTAVNILMNNIGSSKLARQAISQYATFDLSPDFTQDNITCAKFALDVITHLYENQDRYQELIDYMKQSSMGIYLKKYIDDYDVAHKYGSYEGYVHDYGIVYGSDTYMIGIFTKNVSNADEFIAQVSLDILNLTEEQ